MFDKFKKAADEAAQKISEAAEQAAEQVSEKVSQHSDQIHRGIDKAGTFVDEKTGGKYADRIQAGQDKLRDGLDRNQQTAAARRGDPAAGDPAGSDPSASEPNRGEGAGGQGGGGAW